MKQNPVGWFEIYANDLSRAKHFYESVLKTKLEMMKPTDGSGGLEMWGFSGSPELNGAFGALCKMEGVNAGGSGTMVYFSCDDCAAEEKRAKEFGGKVHKAKHSIGPFGFISIVVDTEGNFIGFHSMS